MSSYFSLTEAAAISGLSPEAIRTALEKNTMPLSRRHRVGKGVRHGFSVDDVFLLKMLLEFPFPLPRADKAALRALLTRKAHNCGPWRRQGRDLVFSSRDMTIVVECKVMRDRLSQNAALFRWGQRRIASIPDILNGTPVFRGTRIPVDHIGKLLVKGISEQEILEDFPGLTPRDLSYSKLHLRLGTQPGRPRKRLQLRRNHKAA